MILPRPSRTGFPFSSSFGAPCRSIFPVSFKSCPLAFSFPAQRTSWQALLEGRDESVSAIGIFRQYAELFGLPLCSRAIRYEATSCLYTVVQLCGEQASATEYLAPLLAYVQEHGLTVTGDPIARTFLSMNKRNHYTRYRQIWLPIQETKKSP